MATKKWSEFSRFEKAFIICAVVLGLGVLIFNNDDNHPSKTHIASASQQTQTQKSEYEKSVIAEVLYLKIMKENLPYSSVPLFAAGLITYNHDCASLDNIIMDEAHKIAKDRISDMEQALWNTKVLADGTVGARPRFCAWFKENVIDKIQGASLK